MTTIEEYNSGGLHLKFMGYLPKFNVLKYLDFHKAYYFKTMSPKQQELERIMVDSMEWFRYIGIDYKDETEILEGDIIELCGKKGIIIYYQGCFWVEWCDNKQKTLVKDIYNSISRVTHIKYSNSAKLLENEEQEKDFLNKIKK